MTDLKSVSIWNNINLLLRSHFKRLRIFLIRERVRVSCGHLCEAEAPTEAAAETVSVEWLTEGEKIIRLTLLRNNPSVAYLRRLPSILTFVKKKGAKNLCRS